MQLTQIRFPQGTQALDIPSHPDSCERIGFDEAFDAGSVAVVLISGYTWCPGEAASGILFGRDRRHVLMYDPVALKNEHGAARAPQTCAVPWSAPARMIQVGGDRIRPAIIIRKGLPQ
jgi:Peptidase_C39 like family